MDHWSGTNMKKYDQNMDREIIDLDVHSVKGEEWKQTRKKQSSSSVVFGLLNWQVFDSLLVTFMTFKEKTAVFNSSLTTEINQL